MNTKKFIVPFILSVKKSLSTEAISDSEFEIIFSVRSPFMLIQESHSYSIIKIENDKAQVINLTFVTSDTHIALFSSLTALTVVFVGYFIIKFIVKAQGSEGFKYHVRRKRADVIIDIRNSVYTLEASTDHLI